MAGSIKGIEIAIKADTTGVTSGLKEITQQSMATSKNLKTVNSLLKLDPKNTTLVKEQHKLLSQSISTTKEKLDQLKASQNDVNAAFKRGEISEEEYVAFQGELTRTSARLQDLRQQAEESGVGIDGLKGHIKNAGEHLKNGLVIGAKAAAAAVAAVGAAVIGASKQLADFTKEASVYADTILTEADVTGIATDKLQAYHYAVEFVDVSTETLTGSMAKNIKAMSNAAKGSASVAEAYKTLGVEVTDGNGNLRDSEEVYWEVIDALGSMENETERDATAMTILGKSAQDLNPLIKAGSQRMEELAQEAQNAGAIMSKDSLDSFLEYNNQIHYLEANGAAAKRALGTLLLPALTTLGTTGNSLIKKFTNGINDANGDAGKMAQVFGSMIPEVIGAFVEQLPQILEMAATVVKSLAEGIIAQLPLIIDTAGELILMLAQGITENLPELIPAVVDVVLQITESLIDNIDLLVDASIALILALAEGLINALPVLLAKAPVIIQKLVDAIIANVPKILGAAVLLIEQLVKGIIDSFPAIVDAGKQILETLWNALKSGYNRAVETGTQIVTWVGDGIKSMVSSAVQWGKDLIQGLIDGIKGKIADIKNAVGEVAETIKSYLHFSVPDVGPLTTYESWMPDFMHGLAQGIRANKHLVTEAMQDLTSDMSVNANASLSGGGGIGSQVINVNWYGNVSSNMDLQDSARQIGQMLQSEMSANASMKGLYA